MPRTLATAARLAHGVLHGADAVYGNVSSDSRTLGAGELFVALRGPNFDGEEFIAGAAQRGAVGAIVSRHVPQPLPQIIVPDTLAALQSFARSWRDQFEIPVVAVAGSNGKTTTKEMIASILAQNGATLSTRGNLNNHIGVPLTLTRLDATHRAAVIELGANRAGDVAQLMQWVRPTVSVVTNAGAEHLEGFGDLAGVARAEGEAFAELNAGATAVINADDAFADLWRELAGQCEVSTFGSSERAQFTARDVTQTSDGGRFITRFSLISPLGTRPITLHVGGKHNLVNALAAAAAASAAGASLDAIARGLEAFRAVSGRLQLKAGARGTWIIDDSYNANPSSVHAGLDVLRELDGATWFVFADMAELGDYAAASHAEVGRHARRCGVSRLFATGVESSRAAEAFGDGAEWFPDVDALIRRVSSQLEPGVTLLVKGSRINRLERVVQALSADEPAQALSPEVPARAS